MYFPFLELTTIAHSAHALSVATSRHALSAVTRRFGHFDGKETAKEPIFLYREMEKMYLLLPGGMLRCKW